METLGGWQLVGRGWVLTIFSCCFSCCCCCCGLCTNPWGRERAETLHLQSPPVSAPRKPTGSHLGVDMWLQSKQRLIGLSCPSPGSDWVWMQGRPALLSGAWVAVGRGFPYPSPLGTQPCPRRQPLLQAQSLRNERLSGHP